MMPLHDSYYYHRAETELRLAQNARDPAASRAHYELANLYLDRFYNPGGEPAMQSYRYPTRP